jgi:hypothetical protein
MKTEYSLEFNYKFLFDDYVTGCKKFFTCFKSSSGDVIANFNSETNPAEPAQLYAADKMTLQDFYNLKANFLDREIDLDSHDDGQFFTGVVILYGLNNMNDKDIRLIYRPVYADISRNVESGGNYLKEFAFSSLTLPTIDPHTVTEYFIWAENAAGAGKEWQALDYVTAKAMQKNYQDTVRISHEGDPDPAKLTKFVFGMKDSDDARGVFFSFQEIKKFLDTPTPEAVTIYVTNIAEKDPKYSTFKHSIAFSNKIPGSVFGSAIAANFGTLCPPGTGSIMITNMEKQVIPAMRGLGSGGGIATNITTENNWLGITGIHEQMTLAEIINAHVDKISAPAPAGRYFRDKFIYPKTGSAFDE